MYVPALFSPADLATIHALLRDHPFAAWTTLVDGQIEINHLPFLFDASRGPHGTLSGHVARANPVWRCFSRSVESVVIFRGAQSYVSPSFYPSKQATGEVVPTWNYVVAHAHGVPRVVDDAERLLAHVTELSAVHETKTGSSWAVSDAPAAYIQRMVAAIVGIEIELTSLVGKWKVSQNRGEADRRGAAAGLRARGEEEAVEMARIIEAADEE